jgi:hypothetical protein
METNKTDVRLYLSWYSVKLSSNPLAPPVFVAPFDGKSANLGLGVAEGVQHFYDVHGRVSSIAKKDFDKTAKKTPAREIDFPVLSDDAQQKRFSFWLKPKKHRLQRKH